MHWLTVRVLALAIAVTMTDADAQKTIVTLGTATPGGGFPVYGAAFADAVNAAAASLHIEPRNTKGSAENIPLLEAGTIDLGLVQGEAAYEAFAGIGRAPVNLKIVTAMYSSPGMFAVRADSPYRTIKDLAGKPIAFGARGSGLVILARYVLDGLGLDQEKISGRSVSIAPAMVRRWCWTAAPPRCGAGVAAGRVSLRWPRLQAARALSHPRPTRSRRSAPSMRS
jgi:TRAP transporter TAXI family solute receptor